jgi:hypothetical protein
MPRQRTHLSSPRAGARESCAFIGTQSRDSLAQSRGGGGDELIGLLGRRGVGVAEQFRDEFAGPFASRGGNAL